MNLPHDLDREIDKAAKGFWIQRRKAKRSQLKKRRADAG